MSLELALTVEDQISIDIIVGGNELSSFNSFTHQETGVNLNSGNSYTEVISNPFSGAIISRAASVRTSNGDVAFVGVNINTVSGDVTITSGQELSNLIIDIFGA